VTRKAHPRKRAPTLTTFRAPLVYGVYRICVTAGATMVLARHSLVRVAVDVEMLNALLLPIVIGFLVALAWTTLRRPYRLCAWLRSWCWK
jgi:hypothetical protein